MYFRENAVSDFLDIFNESKNKIRAFKGCVHLELLQSNKDSSHLMTLSHWENEEALENYRQSDLFRSTWAKTKILFEKKPYAVSLKKIAEPNL